MKEWMTQVLPLATLAFAVSSMLSVGLAHTVGEIITPLRNKLGVALVILANFLLVPMLAYLAGRLLGLEPSLAIGLFLVGAAAGAPFSLKLTQVAGGDMAFATSVLLLLLPVSVLYVTFVVPLVLPEENVSALAIASPLIWSLLLPLAVGLILRKWVPRWAMKASPFLGKLASVSLVMLLVATVIAHGENFIALGPRALAAAVLLAVGAFIIGYSLGGKVRQTRRVVAFSTAQRNIAAATVVATQTFEGRPAIVVMVVASSVVMALLLFPLAYAMRLRQTVHPPIRLSRRQEA